MKTPEMIDLRQDSQGRYYDAAREREVESYNAGDPARVYWFICYFSTEPKEEPYEAEEDVLAPNRAEASAVMRAALARDFDPGVQLTKVVLA